MSISEHKHMPEPVRRMVVFTGAGRRRTWSAAEKAAILAESYGGGETGCGVARGHWLAAPELVDRAKRADRVKLIFWDGTGVVLVAKRLENGKFNWPTIHDGVMRLSAAQLQALLEGLDWRRVHEVRRTAVPAAAS